jgi:hypothetical protein
MHGRPPDSGVSAFATDAVGHIIGWFTDFLNTAATEGDSAATFTQDFPQKIPSGAHQP